MAIKFTKSTLIVTVFIILLVSSVLLYTVTHLKSSQSISENDNVPGVENNNVKPSAKNQGVILQQKRNAVTPITDISASLEDLDILLDEDNLNTWGQLSFADINKGEKFRSFLSRYELKDSKYKLSDEQNKSFINHLEQTCIAYNAGTYEEFEKYRIPTDQYTYDSDKLDWYKYSLINYYDTSASDIPKDSKELVKLYWSKKNKSDTSFVGLWEAVHTPRVSIRKSNSLPMRLIDMAELLDKSALGGSKLINFDRSPSVILKEQQEIVYADTEYVVRHKTGLSYPIVIRSFWDNESKKWFPDEILICYTGKGRLVDPEF